MNDCNKFVYVNEVSEVDISLFNSTNNCTEHIRIVFYSFVFFSMTVNVMEGLG